jgi:DNA-binding Lrp family transcriptional regulator
MDSLDRVLLDCLQYDFPLTTQPYATMARRLPLGPRETIGRITRLKTMNIIRQIGPIFDSSKIGYRSVLAAFKVPPGRLDAVAQAVSGNPAVTHNYARSGDYNLWFTVTQPESRDLLETVDRMAKDAGVSDRLFLPTVRNFKIGFRLEMGKGERTSPAEQPGKEHSKRLPANFAINKAFVRELQKDLPVSQRPYRSAARKLGLTEGRVVAELGRYLEAGAIRRIAAVLKPVNAGYPVNILTVWNPAKEHKEILGLAAAERNQVSHCYERPACKDWPYSIYTMIHGKSLEECRGIIRSLSGESGVSRYKELTTIKEYKKSRVEYFPL